MLRNKNKGITLIALVVTIILLLILAGVSLSLIFGENGLINKAIEVKDIVEKSEQEDKNAKDNIFAKKPGNVEPNESQYVSTGDIYYYTPDLSGFNKTCTYYITYDSEGNNEQIYGRLDKIETPTERMA